MNYLKIVGIKNSKRKNKRFQVLLNNGEKYDFGLLGGHTYLDHHDGKKRRAYWARHTKNKNEGKLIGHLTPSPALFSAYLLWGSSTNLGTNIEDLNNLWKRLRIKG